MPYIPTTFGLAILLVVVSNIYAADNTLRCGNLIWTHNKEHPFTRKYTILGEDVYERMLGEEGACKVNQVVDCLVVAVCPKR